MLRLALALCLVGCISKAKEAIAPEPTGTGTLTCREIVENCDSQCSDPICLNRCSNEGTQEGAAQHATLLDCGQRNSCTDEDCMKANCPNEIATCMGAAEQAPASDPPPAEPSSAPGATPGG